MTPSKTWNCQSTLLNVILGYPIYRWFIVHISYVYLMREMFSKVNTGPAPPPILLLSDGGHVENLAILPLLKRRLPKIVVVDGGYKHEEKLYGVSLLDALMLARTKLNCSFVSEDGHDVISDLLEKFVKPKTRGNPRYYKYALETDFFHLFCYGSPSVRFCSVGVAG